MFREHEGLQCVLPSRVLSLVTALVQQLYEEVGKRGRAIIIFDHKLPFLQ